MHLKFFTVKIEYPSTSLANEKHFLFKEKAEEYRKNELEQILVKLKTDSRIEEMSIDTYDNLIEITYYLGKDDCPNFYSFYLLEKELEIEE
ncbi:MAG: hypothetical protein LC122_13830 [Chitinophagales bacterium]|nr:hypothetical protein [Chitinophagales bacterium]